MKDLVASLNTNGVRERALHKELMKNYDAMCKYLPEKENQLCLTEQKKQEQGHAHLVCIFYHPP